MRQIVRRDVHRAHDPVVAHVEDVDAGGRLLEVAEERAPAGERAREDRAVDAPVQDGEQDVPAVVGQQAVDRGQDAVEERADRLAGEEARVLRDDELLDRLRTAGRRTVEERYGFARRMEKIAAIYDDLLGRTPLGVSSTGSARSDS